MDSHDIAHYDDRNGSTPPGSNSRDKIKRGYRACLHCRSRKAKCDLGDIDAPSSPPCSRCRRESRECVFAPSRRGGNNIRRKKDESESDGLPEPARMTKAKPPAVAIPGTTGGHNGNHASSSRNESGWMAHPPPAPPARATASSSLGFNPSQHMPPTGYTQMFAQPRSGRNEQSHRPSSSSGIPLFDPHIQPRYGAPLNELLQSPTQHQANSNPYANIINLGPDPSPANSHSPAHSTNHPHTPHSGNRPIHLARDSDGPTTTSPKRRRLHLNPPLHAADPSSIVVADMQNESDALHILALASESGPGKKGQRQQRSHSPSSTKSNSALASNRAKGKGTVKELKDFALVKLGIVDETKVVRLCEVFFRCHHHLYPMVPSAVIPRTYEQVTTFAQNERYLLTAIIIIASRNDQSLRDVHDKSWAVFRGWMSDVQCLGAQPTVGLVEGLLLLAENLPRDPVRSKVSDPDLHAIGLGEDVHGAENRQAWMLIGAAVRHAYGLGLDKLALKLIHESERTLEVERARLAWTYCYLFDRHVSLRLGLAFWSRGPAVCFTGFSSSAQTGPPAGTRNFPFLREIRPEDPGGEHPQEDLAGLVQAYVELTQLMSNAHDCLYPNAARTRSIVMYGEYFKYIDELARSLDGFKILWRQKKWNVFPLTDALWAMFYYTQLYICAFSFQAHVERAAMRAEEEYRVLDEQHKAAGALNDLPRPPMSLFPRGAAASPDARYIFQSCDAARTLLHICVDSLSPGGALPFLPSRYLLWFTYAAIVLLKALYSGAMLRADHAETLKLIDRLCACLAAASSDEDHPAVRYGRQLEELSKKLAGQGDTTTGSPTGGHTVPLPPMHGRPSNDEKSIPTLSSISSSLPWLNQQSQMPPNYAESPVWTFPPAPTETQDFTFAYPNTPLPMPTYVAPPHQQPMSDMTSLQPESNPLGMGTGQNNLGFVQLDDWFGNGTGGVNGDDDGNAGFGALDLQDFWMKVGPGEAQGGFPFR